MSTNLAERGPRHASGKTYGIWEQWTWRTKRFCCPYNRTIYVCTHNYTYTRILPLPEPRSNSGKWSDRAQRLLSFSGQRKHSSFLSYFIISSRDLIFIDRWIRETFKYWTCRTFVLLLLHRFMHRKLLNSFVTKWKKETIGFYFASTRHN